MTAFLLALVEYLISVFQKEAEKPKTLEDANTPKTVLDGWRANLRERLRDKGGGN